MENPKPNARPRRTPEQGVEGLLALKDVLQVRVDAPRSPYPKFSKGRDSDRWANKHQRLLDVALKISELASENVDVKLDGVGIKTVVDNRNYRMGAVFRRGPISKSIVRSLRNGLLNWPG